MPCPFTKHIFSAGTLERQVIWLCHPRVVWTEVGVEERPETKPSLVFFSTYVKRLDPEKLQPYRQLGSSRRVLRAYQEKQK
jgi:hypothetical protein